MVSFCTPALWGAHSQGGAVRAPLPLSRRCEMTPPCVKPEPGWEYNIHGIFAKLQRLDGAASFAFSVVWHCCCRHFLQHIVEQAALGLSLRRVSHNRSSRRLRKAPGRHKASSQHSSYDVETPPTTSLSKLSSKTFARSCCFQCPCPASSRLYKSP